MQHTDTTDALFAAIAEWADVEVVPQDRPKLTVIRGEAG